MSQVNVTFYTVKNGSSKVAALLKTVDTHMLNKEKITVIVPDEKALTFTKNLLWSLPKESFRPNSSKGDLISVTLSDESSEAGVIFNLSSVPHAPSSHVKKIYELEDMSHPDKAALFQKKFQAYQKQGFLLAAGTL
jgi:DNA polymerase IIIc chi subunit